MPSLELFGKRTALSGDDLYIFTLFAIALRIIQLGFLIPLLVLLLNVDRADNEKTCVRNRQQYSDRGYTMFITYWSLTFIVVVLSLLVEVLILKTSVRGSAVEVEARKLLKPLCAVKLIPLATLRVVALVIGILASDLIDDYCTCGAGTSTEKSAFVPVDADEVYIICPKITSLYWIINGLLVISAIEVTAGFVLHLYFILQVLKPRHHLKSLAEAMICRQRSISTERGQGWKITCQLCCTCTSVLTCCLFGGLEASTSNFVDISLILEQLFDDGGYLDVTLSDIIEGLALVSQRQREEREEARIELLRSKEKENSPSKSNVAEELGTLPNKTLRCMSIKHTTGERGECLYSCEPCDRPVLNPEVKEDHTRILEGAHFMPVAFAIYGFGMQLIDQPVRGAFNLAAGALCCHGWNKSVSGDNMCGCNTIAFLDESGLEPEDVIYASLQTGVERRPYCITLDKEWKAIVVVVRGTFALEDAVTDLTIKPTSLDECGEQFGFNGQGEYAHSGMFESAAWVNSDIEEHGILDKLLVGDSCHYPGYKLYVIGHSLGAGVAALLSLMLQKKYNSLKCLCFEPPGCVMTKKAADQEYITSYVLNSDIVPRLSLQAVEHLRDSVLLMIARAKLPKHQVLSPGLFCSGPGHEYETENGGNALHRMNSTPESLFYSQVLEFWTYQDQIKEERGERTVLLLPPGRKIVHLVKTKETSKNFGDLFTLSSTTEPYTAVYAKSDDFLEIQLAGSYMSDHYPGLATRELQRIAKNSFSSPTPNATV